MIEESWNMVIIVEGTAACLLNNVNASPAANPVFLSVPSKTRHTRFFGARAKRICPPPKLQIYRNVPQHGFSIPTKGKYMSLLLRSLSRLTRSFPFPTYNALGILNQIRYLLNKTYRSYSGITWMACNFYDVSIPIIEGMIVYPGNPNPSIKQY